jgi:16S rRNA (cytosine1402-N4)-methyltransferase
VSQRPHIPVLLHETLAALSPQPGQTIIDCTLGLGGHSSAILDKLKPGGHLIAIDFDPTNIAAAQDRISKTHGPSGRHVNYTLHHNNFAAVQTILAGPQADALLADIGVASTQIDDPTRGFSYRRPGPLDMRMDPTRGQPASALLARLSQLELTEALQELGDEEDAAPIAKLIVEQRTIEPITTTERLTAIICEARNFTLERAANAKLHPAARTFQALRILTNRELANLDRLLAVLPSCIKPNGIAAIITFHSGEDRKVKAAFREGLRAGTYSDISEDPITADESEIHRNPRSRSAKLRWARLA